MTEPEAQHRWIDAEAAARILGVSGRTIRDWCRRGLVASYRTFGLARRYQLRDDALDSLRESMTNEVTREPEKPEKPDE